MQHLGNKCNIGNICNIKGQLQLDHLQRGNVCNTGRFAALCDVNEFGQAAGGPAHSNVKFNLCEVFVYCQ